MSKLKIKSVKNNALLKELQFLLDDQRRDLEPLSVKWSDPRFHTQLDEKNRIRENGKLVMHTASDVVSETKIWIYLDWLQQGQLTVVAGPPSSGKTTFACALAAGITRGKDYSLAPGLTPMGSGHVIIINKEDDIATGLKPRLEAAGADASKVHFLGCNGGLEEDSLFSFFNEQDLERLEGRVKELNNNLGLIIVDPVYCAVDGDLNNSFKARQAYEGLAKLAKRLTCAILGIAHTVRNPQNKNPIARIAGPPALREVPRAFMLLSKICNGPTTTGGTHVLVHAKNNEGKSDGGYEYCFTSVDIHGKDGITETKKFHVTAQLSGSAEDILNKADKGMPIKSFSKFDTAVMFLEEILVDGPKLWIDVKKRAEEGGVSKGTLMNAKSFLKIVTKKQSVDGRSVWRLPDSYFVGD